MDVGPVTTIGLIYGDYEMVWRGGMTLWFLAV
jgi:hypothetical protein